MLLLVCEAGRERKRGREKRLYAMNKSEAPVRVISKGKEREGEREGGKATL